MFLEFQNEIKVVLYLKQHETGSSHDKRNTRFQVENPIVTQLSMP
jgi:hypothetical protein